MKRNCSTLPCRIYSNHGSLR